MELCLGGFRRKLFYRLSYNWRFADFLSVLICIIVNGLMWLFGPLLGNVYPLDVVGGPLKKALIDRGKELGVFVPYNSVVVGCVASVGRRFSGT